MKKEKRIENQDEERATTYDHADEYSSEEDDEEARKDTNGVPAGSEEGQVSSSPVSGRYWGTGVLQRAGRLGVALPASTGGESNVMITV